MKKRIFWNTVFRLHLARFFGTKVFKLFQTKMSQIKYIYLEIFSLLPMISSFSLSLSFSTSDCFLLIVTLHLNWIFVSSSSAFSIKIVEEWLFIWLQTVNIIKFSSKINMDNKHLYINLNYVSNLIRNSNVSNLRCIFGVLFSADAVAIELDLISFRRCCWESTYTRAQIQRDWIRGARGRGCKENLLND